MIGYWTGDGKEPQHAHDDDAGFDLAYSGDQPLIVEPHTTCNVPTSISVQLPRHTWAMVTGRSSTFKRGLMTPVSVIDNGYRGELFAIVHNFTSEAVVIMPQERVAQLIVIDMLADLIAWQHTDRLDETQRGANGFGSTGK